MVKEKKKRVHRVGRTGNGGGEWVQIGEEMNMIKASYMKSQRTNIKER